MQESYCVYMHTFPNGKRYIGVTKTKPEYRWNNGKGYSRQAVYNAIVKYGWENVAHEILSSGLTQKEAERQEKEYIKKYRSNSKEFGYNIAEGGNTTSGIKLTKERRQQISECNRQRVMSQETKEKLRLANLGKKANNETKQRMGDQRKGAKNPFYGKTHSDEAKRKVSIANAGANNKKSYAIAQYTIEKQFVRLCGSLREAEKYGYNRRKFCGKLSEDAFVECGGFLWRKTANHKEEKTCN